MRNYVRELPIFRIAATPQATFTAATTDIITSNSHGLQDGDCVWVSTSNTLPAGLSASTNYYVINPTTNTFQLSATLGGPTVDITTTGTGTHTYNLKGRKIYGMDFRHWGLELATSGSANMTIKIQSSDQDDVDFNAAQSPTNRWDYIQIKDLEDEASTDGDSGFALTGTDDNRRFAVNTDHGSYLCAQITSWTAGKLNLMANMYND